MASSISSLGIGSGVLTADVIEQLKAADESRLITPIDNKLDLQKQKETAFDLLNSLISSFKSSVSALSYDSLYGKRSVSVTGGNLEVVAEAGAAPESFTLKTVQLAQKNIQQSGTFASATSTVADGSGTMGITVNGTTYNVAYTASTTLEGLATAINDAAGTAVKASVLQTGASEYRLVLSSQNTGSDQTISVSDTPDTPGSGLVDAIYNDATLTSGFTTVLNAQDAILEYNGISVTRSSNEVSDLINGVTLKLKSEGETANVNITQDQEAIVTEMKLFVESYNTLISNLRDMTMSNQETGAQGVFNGDNFIKSISREINNILISVSSDNKSLMNYGIDIDKSGTMSFNSTTFKSALASDPTGVNLFLAGGYDTATGQTKTGLFSTLNDKITEYTGYNGLLNNYQSNLDKKMSSLNDERSRMLASLESRYEILTKRFSAYDAVISKINAQFSSLNMMIQAEVNAKS
ncbi:MAG: flagellar filament capping protein FliD [Campylobacterota bacterium]